jgi:malonate-semialdehyde dehydrogenase (acetylating)/methylmalonate-semialdehyde dehydrogenase
VPPGILNIVHGGKDVGQAITNHPDIKAVSFIGSAVGKFLYAHGAANGKRMLCMDGAKNHGVILPDAEVTKHGCPRRPSSHLTAAKTTQANPL